MKASSDEAATNKLEQRADEHLRSRDIGFEIWKTNPESDRESFKALAAGLTLKFETLLSLLEEGERLTEQDVEKWRESMQFALFSTILATILLTVRLTGEE
jgi:hypothetical protein